MANMTDLLSPLRRERDHTKFVGKLKELHDARADYVIPTSAITSTINPQHEVTVRLTAPDPLNPFLLPDGVAQALATSPTRTALGQLASRLRIPLPYLERLIYHDESNGRNLGAHSINQLAELDGGRMLARLWRADDGWVLRALMSDRYQAIDNWTVLSAFTNAMGQAEIDLADCEVDVDLTPDRFRMRVAVPQVEAMAEDLLRDYRMPFSMRSDRDWHSPPEPGEKPAVWAGFELANSEAGKGAITLAKRVVVTVCRNGLTRPHDIRRTHLGVQLEQGSVDWSGETQGKVMELITSQIKDAVSAFCSTDALEDELAEMRRAKNVEVEAPSVAIQQVAAAFELADEEADTVMDCFTRGGDTSVFGVAQAVTAAAQLVADGDRQSEIETKFWSIVESPERFAGV